MKNIRAKYKIGLVFLITTVVLTLGFQNCTQTKFSEIPQTLSSVAAEVVPQATPSNEFEPIAVLGKATSDDAIDVVLFMDFSYSMKSELARVKNALSNFLDQQKTRQAFNLYVYPIYDTPISVQTQGAIPLGTTVQDVLKSPLAQMQLRNNANFATEKATFLNQIQQQINNISSYSGETNEVGLCQLVRVIKKSNIFNNVSANKKFVALFVTDEDDGSLVSYGPSLVSSCIEKAVATTHRVYTTLRMHWPVVHLWATYTFSGMQKVDGGAMEPYTLPNAASNLGACANNTYGIDCTSTASVACPASFVNALKASSTPDRTVTEVTNCIFFARNDVMSESYFSVDKLTTLDGQPLTETTLNQLLNQSIGFKYYDVIYSNLNDYANRLNITGAIFQGWWTTMTDWTYTPYPEFASGSVSTSYQAIMNLINQKIPNPANVAMDFVIYNPTQNPAGVFCAAQDVGVLGSNYLSFVSQAAHPGLVKTESICQDNYEAALAHATVVTVWTPERTYALTGYNLFHAGAIKTVKIFNAQGELVALLQKTVHFDVVNNQLVIKASVPESQLKAGYKLMVSLD